MRFLLYIGGAKVVILFVFTKFETDELLNIFQAADGFGNIDKVVCNTFSIGRKRKILGTHLRGADTF